MVNKESQLQDLTYLSSYISKVMKKMFGKGPESCTIARENNLVIVRVQHFITPAEDVLVNHNELGLALKFRMTLLKAFFEKTKSEISTLTNLEIDSFYHDWDYEYNHGILIFVAGLDFQLEEKSEMNVLHSALCEKVKMISGKVHKKPNFVNVVKVNPSIYLFECLDVLIESESLLYKNGDVDLLVERSQDIRKRYSQYIVELESIFDCPIKHLFLVWNYAGDRCYLAVYLR